MLIEVHIIQNHAPSNLNRDDSGSPKSAMFGGYRRARISSQCLKRCYRTSVTFRDAIDDLGMHTRAMPDEIRRRLLDHAKTVTDNDLRKKFEEWADRCRDKLASVFGKSSGGGGESSGAGASQHDDSPPESKEGEPADDGAADEDKTISGGEQGEEDQARRSEEKGKTAQSVFWRELELQTLFDAYRERIEWDKDVPDGMRKAFDSKDKVKPGDMLKQAANLAARDSFTTRAKAVYDAESGKLAGKQGKAKTAAEETRVAGMLANLILERFDPKKALEDCCLRVDGIPVDMALFGRMVTSDLMHNVEASSQFAHAISTHEWQREFDLWTRVDDRRDKRLDFYKSAFGAEEKLESGTDGMGDAEFTSACYYSYFNVDFGALVDNLTGKALKHDLDDSADRAGAKERACAAVVGLIRAAIFERPTGKFNSMATPSLPTAVLVELRNSHVPVSYADAFAKPVDPKNEEKQNDRGQIERVDLPTESAKRLIQEANRITKAFNREARARYLFTGGKELGAKLDNGPVPAETVDSVDDLVKSVRITIGCPESTDNG